MFSVLEQDLFGDSTMPFHLRLQAHQRQVLIGGLMSNNVAARKESVRKLGVVDAQLYRKKKLAEREVRGTSFALLRK